MRDEAGKGEEVNELDLGFQNYKKMDKKYIVGAEDARENH